MKKFEKFKETTDIKLIYIAPGDYKHRKNGKRDVTGNLNFIGKEWRNSGNNPPLSDCGRKTVK